MTPRPINDAHKELEQYERSYCDCSKCTLACKHMPGTLAPGDFEKIAAYLEQPANVSFLENFFVASDGPLVAKKQPDGVVIQYQIPTLVPAQHENGECVFLGENGECEIHPVAPFGCRNYKVCDDSANMADSLKSAHLLNVICRTPSYGGTVEYLEDQGLKARPLMERKRRLLNALKKEQEGGGIEGSQDS